MNKTWSGAGFEVAFFEDESDLEFSIGYISFVSFAVGLIEKKGLHCGKPCESKILGLLGLW
jgi:hypothetical protein